MTDDRQAPHVATPEVEDALRDKIRDIARQERERQTQQLANSAGLGYISLVGFPIGPETISLIPRSEAENLRIVCFLKTGTQIRLGVVDYTLPDLPPLIEALGTKHNANVELYLISEHSYDSAMKLYDRLPRIIPQTDELRLASEDIERYRQNITDIHQLKDRLKGATITDVFVWLVAAALSAEASDIHIEAEADCVRVRFRLDGVLTPVAELSLEQWPRIVARIKLLAHLKLNITTTPQDGRVTVFMPDEKIDIRVSTLPTAFGESVVMRLLRPSATSINFAELGLRGLAFDRLEAEIKKPNGMVVITGPTGSGKTTTLYAALKQLNTPETKIITLEDPIEYKLEGVNQSQVDWAKNYTFASGLRSIMRQDPDIIMVGEIRDLETAETAVQAALTGHLVLSTIHTNDAAGAVPRFLSMGTKPYLLAPALNVIVAQRLVRKICQHCVTEDHVDQPTMTRVKEVLEAIPASSRQRRDSSLPLTFHRGAGCPACQGLGYKGRIGVFEVLVVDAAAEKLILGGTVSEYQVRELAENQGMITMIQDGVLKALDGLTTIEDVFRVTQ